eukprot:TRINITY_DN9844_c0_g1_i11.p1 TRINITY_DN9844_c0_g1~~TRINITY_DN9844_c0_g1_i11.p1  ORF type:complete len:412 (-),score=93.99 TRINITY_DN9844_c0_g1_i11:350-1585(-)
MLRSLVGSEMCIRDRDRIAMNPTPCTLVDVLQPPGLSIQLAMAAFTWHYNPVRARKESSRVLCTLEESSKMLHDALKSVANDQYTDNPWYVIARLHDPKCAFTMSYLNPETAHRDWRSFVKGSKWNAMAGREFLEASCLPVITRTLLDQTADQFAGFKREFDCASLYPIVFSGCTAKVAGTERTEADDMYALAKQTVADFDTKLSTICIAGKAGEARPDPVSIAQAWRRHQELATIIQQVFGYLDRYHCPRHGLPGLQQLCRDSLATHVLPTIPVMQVLDAAPDLPHDLETWQGICQLASACSIPIPDKLAGIARIANLAEHPPNPDSVVFVAGDGTEQALDQAAVRLSSVLAALAQLDSASPKPVVFLPDVEGAQAFAMASQYLDYHSGLGADTSEIENEAWDKQFVVPY